MTTLIGNSVVHFVEGDEPDGQVDLLCTDRYGCRASAVETARDEASCSYYSCLRVGDGPGERAEDRPSRVCCCPYEIVFEVLDAVSQGGDGL